MNKTRLKEVGIRASVYVLGLLIGVLIIFAVEWHQQSTLKANAVRAATQIKEEQKLENGYIYMHINIYLLENGELTYLMGHVSNQYGQYEPYIQKYFLAADTKKDGITYGIIPDVFNRKFIAAASAPVDENRKIILFHEIRYMGSILFIYVLLFTFFFCLVTAFHYVLARKNEKINEIYRCYTANVSHELKSPITSIQAVTSALNEGLVEDEETRRRYYGIIYREARQLEYTVQDILELSKIQEHRIDMAKGKVDGKELLMDICQKYRECCEEMDICFKAPEWTEKFPSLMLLTNADRIRQVLDILFDNAVKFLPEDREGQIELDVEIRRKKALISLKDNGIGIPESDLSHVFERFYRSRKNSSIKGTGLGLAIAKEIMTELHEQIGVESIEDVGTRFYFSVERV